MYPTLLPWYAIRTRSNQEKLASTILTNKQFETYFPVYRVRRRWSDRTVEAELPFFPGYVFCRLDVMKRMPVLTTPGVVGILGIRNSPVSIPECEIEAVQAILDSGLGVEPCPFLQVGQRIRITDGPLTGLEGILVKKKSECRFVVSVHMLQRSISVEVDPHSIDAL